MKVLSLFDGLAGARQALKELNIDCEYYASEIDKYAIQVAKTNHPDIVHIGDVKKFQYRNLAQWQYISNDGHEVYDKIPIIDLLIGGSPCQDLSIAKKDRKGLDGDRSSLFYEYLRILNEVKPKYFILENVASMSKASKEIITKELFDIEPIMINSSLLTAQNRKRYYWVGKLVDGKYRQVKIEQPEDRKIYLKDIIEDNISFPVVMDTRQISREKNPRFYAKGKSPTLNASMYKDMYKIFDKPLRIGQLSKDCQSGRIYSIDGKSVCLNAGGGGGGAKTGLYEFKDGIRKLTVTECERLQGFPEGYCDMVSKTQAYKALGNSFTVPVIKHILKNILTNLNNKKR